MQTAAAATEPLRLPVGELQRSSVLQWFHSNWRLPQRGETPLNVELVPRKQLRRQLNHLLQTLGLPLWTERATLWTDWFLGDVLRLPADEIKNGKPLRLVRLHNADDWVSSLRYLLAQVELQRTGAPRLIPPPTTCV